MRKWLVIGSGCALLLAGVAVVWPTGGPTSDPAPAHGPAASAPRRFDEVAVTASAGQGLTLTGTVRDAGGRPVPNAQVHLAASSQESLGSATCQVCGEPLLACEASETLHEVHALLSGGHGLLTPAVSTRAGADGTFRFEGLAGVSFTVWGEAQGLGVGVRERAAPGEPVELFLPPARSLVGTVRDERGRSVPGAEVVALSRRVSLRQAARVGGDGRFVLPGLGEGPFYVLVSAPGFLPEAVLQAEAGPRPLDVSLTRARTLEVQVTRGGKAADAEVLLAGEHLSRTVRTEGGRAVLSGLPHDRVAVSARAGPLAASPRTVLLAEERTRTELTLGEAGVLAVTVLDEQGQPVPEPQLTLRSSAGEQLLQRQGATGELFQLGPLAPGDYLLEGRARGFKEQRLPLRLGTGETPLDLVLGRGLYISGRVLDEYGRPGAGISVLVHPTGDNVLADAQGRFSAEVPTPGLYRLHAHHSDWGGAEVEVTAPAEGVVVSLEPRAGAQVRVFSEGRRVEGADVVMWVDRQGSFRSDRPSGADGLVKMRGMPPGSYWLVASHPDYLPSSRQKVELPDGELVELTAELQPGVALEGQVVDERGSPVPGVAVSVVPRGSLPTQSDAEGHFQLRPLRPKVTYRLEARHPGYEPPGRVAAIAGGEPVKVVMRKREVFRGRVVSERGAPVQRFTVEGEPVESPDGRFELPLPSTQERVVFAVTAVGFRPEMVDRTKAPDLGDIVLESARQLEGTVQDASGPVEGAVVSCEGCEESVLTGRDGRFRLSRPEFVPELTVNARKGSRSAVGRVEAEQERVTLTLEPAVKLSGRVFRPDGQPAAGVEVEAFDLDRAETFTFVTGRDGAYSGEVPPGWYQVLTGGRRYARGNQVTLADLRGSERQLDLGPGPGTQNLDVQLQPQPGHALWVIQGELTRLSSPPVELERPRFGYLVFMPFSDRVTLQGLAPGRYTLVWGRLHAPGQSPLLQVVDVPHQGPVTLTRLHQP